MHLLSWLNQVLQLSFNDKSLELKYQNSYLDEHIPQNILAAKIAIIIYLFYAPLTYLLILNESILLTYVVLFSISMPLFLIFMRESKFFLKYQNFMLYFSAVVAGLGPVIFYVFTENNREVFQVDVLIPLIAIFTMYGISFVLALLSILSILLVFLLLSIVFSLSAIDIFMAMYTMGIGGVVTSIAGYLIEKSKRKLFLSKLKSDEFKYLIDNSHDMIAIYDIDNYKFLYANKTVLEINNCTLETILTKTITEVHPEVTIDMITHMFEQLDNKGQVKEVIKLKKPNSEYYYAHTMLQYGFYKFKKVVINLSSDVTERKNAELKIKEMAERDPLTGLYNRHKLDEFSSILINQYARYKKSFSLIVCDVDYFKDVNDTYGHLEGDKVLKKIANIIENSVRESDVVSRWGGEEFAIVLSNTSLEEATQVAKKINLTVGSYSHKKVGNVFISCGVSMFTEDDTQVTLFKRVDNALYEAKNNGRNQICVK